MPTNQIVSAPIPEVIAKMLAEDSEDFEDFDDFDDFDDIPPEIFQFDYPLIERGGEDWIYGSQFISQFDIPSEYETVNEFLNSMMSVELLHAMDRMRYAAFLKNVVHMRYEEISEIMARRYDWHDAPWDILNTEDNFAMFSENVQYMEPEELADFQMVYRSRLEYGPSP